MNRKKKRFVIWGKLFTLSISASLVNVCTLSFKNVYSLILQVECLRNKEVVYLGVFSFHGLFISQPNDTLVWREEKGLIISNFIVS